MTTISEVELLEDSIRISDLELTGTIVEVAHSLEPGSAERLAALVRDAAEIGATVLRHGQSKAVVDALAGEIDRLISTTTSATEQLPDAVQEQVADLLAKLSAVLAEQFDPKRTDSVQHQISQLVTGATAQQVKVMTQELLGETGPVTAMNDKVVSQLKLVSSSTQEAVSLVAALAEKIEAKLRLDDAAERSTQKGASFEDVLHAELDAIHGPLGDDVRCTKDDYGALPHSQAGDFVVRVNPRETRGREVCFTVEAKTGRLSAPKAKAALEEAIGNREATSGVLVFDGVGDAPLGGRHYGCWNGGRFVAVLDSDELNPLALEVACRQARELAISSVDGETALDAKWLIERCDAVGAVVEQAREILNGANAAQRGVDRIKVAYERLRGEALAVLDEIKQKAA
jgi:hypothetical protein